MTSEKRHVSGAGKESDEWAGFFDDALTAAVNIKRLTIEEMREHARLVGDLNDNGEVVYER